MTKQTIEKTGEEQLIEREFPYQYPGCGKITHKSIIREIINNCAYCARASSARNSRQQAKNEIAAVGLKTLTALASVAVAGGLACLGADALPLSIPATGFTVYWLNRNLRGKHPVSYVGNYISPPYFSILDHLHLAGGWRKIARLQEEGKLSQGGRGVIRTEDCYQEVGRTCY